MFRIIRVDHCRKSALFNSIIRNPFLFAKTYVNFIQKHIFWPLLISDIHNGSIKPRKDNFKNGNEKANQLGWD